MPKYSNICSAARASDLAAVQDIVQVDPKSVFTINSYGFNALHEALIADSCGNVNFELVKFLVGAGCPINQISKGEHPRSPLWIAAEFCPDTEIVQFLIDNGADLATLESAGNHKHVIDCIDNLSEQKAVQQLLSKLTGYPLPEPPPPPKFPDQRADTVTWRKTTAAIKKAFAQLECADIIAIPNASYTVGECIAECFDRLERQPDRNRFVGYCFYTEPNKNRAREYGCLYLNYGMIGDDESGIIELADRIVSLLRQQGFDAEWNGNPDDYINVWLQPFYAAIRE